MSERSQCVSCGDAVNPAIVRIVAGYQAECPACQARGSAAPTPDAAEKAFQHTWAATRIASLESLITSERTPYTQRTGQDFDILRDTSLASERTATQEREGLQRVRSFLRRDEEGAHLL
jgi:hypothetical protein